MEKRSNTEKRSNMEKEGTPIQDIPGTVKITLNLRKTVNEIVVVIEKDLHERTGCSLRRLDEEIQEEIADKWKEKLEELLVDLNEK